MALMVLSALKKKRLPKALQHESQSASRARVLATEAGVSTHATGVM